MTRQEFSKKIADYRKENKIAVKDICFKLSCLPGDVYRIEKGTNSYNLKKCLDYLDAVGLALTIKIGNKTTPKIKNYDELVEFVVNRRKARYTKRAFAIAVGCSPQAVTFFEDKECIVKIDTLLKFGEGLNFSLDVLPVKATKVATTATTNSPHRGKGMTRQALSNMLAAIRKKTKCTLMQMCRRTGMTFIQIQHIETSGDDYNLGDVIKYLGAVNQVMLLKQGNEAIVVSKYEDIPNFLRKVRELKDCSRAELVQATGCSMSSITEMENKNTIMHIDSFLAITSALKIKIELKYR